MDDKPETPVNPYQSPASGAASRDAAHPDRVYGLKEPIRAEGKLSAQDVWPTEKPTLVQRIPTVGWLVVGVALAVFVAVRILSSVFPLPIVMAIDVVVPVLTIVVALYLIGHHGTKRQIRDFERNCSLEKTTISDGELVVEGEHGRSVWRWSAFCQCGCSDQQVLLYVEPDGERLVFPKRFFADEGDWEAFVDLVRFKLPEDEASARELVKTPRESVADEATSAQEPEETEDGDEPSPLIQVEGVLSWKDWKHIQRRIGRPWLDRAMRVGCLLVLIAVLGVPFWLMPSMALAGPSLIAFAVLILFLFFPLFVSPPLKLRRQWKRQEGPFEPFQVRIWDDRMESVAPTATATIPWTTFNRFTLTDRVVLLHQSQPDVVHFIPRAFFSSDEEWENLVAFVREKLSEAPDDAPES